VSMTKGVPSTSMKKPARRFDWEFWLVGLLSLLIFLAVAYYLVFRLNIFVTDSMARTRSAWQVFFSSEPKLANVGFCLGSAAHHPAVAAGLDPGFSRQWFFGQHCFSIMRGSQCAGIAPLSAPGEAAADGDLFAALGLYCQPHDSVLFEQRHE